AESGKSSNRSCRVLVIEDHDDTRLLLEMMMQAEGFETACAATAEEALTLATTFVPDLILSDISLPNVDGYQLLKELRSLPGFKSVPAIALSGLETQGEESSSEEDGFEEYMLKPIDYELLFEKMASLTNNSCFKDGHA